MSKEAFLFNSINSLAVFQGAFFRIFLPSVGLSAKFIYLILTLYNNPVNRPILVNMGFYSDIRNTQTAITTLTKRGYIVRMGYTYHLTGKGESVYLQFIDFARRQGVLMDPETLDK